MNNDALSVSLLTRLIQELLEQEFPVIRVSGEISNYKQHSSGHRYFTLKDEGAQIRVVMWRTRTLTMQPFDGMKVVLSGRISVYPSQGNYQIDCFSMQPAGIGELYIAFEKLKAELQQLGYFDESHKKALPRFPLRVGVATSPTGAAIRDILSTMEQRMPACEVVFRPTLVQGEGSAADIVQAIQALDTAGCEVLIIGRGGGSIEDLWSFNTRAVADAIYHARTPIISAVGHETDVCIADFVADRRAATPTAAAVMCTPVRVDDLMQSLDILSDRLNDAIDLLVHDRLEMVEHWLDGTMELQLCERLRDDDERVQRTLQRMDRAMQQRIEYMKLKVDGIERNMRVLQPLAPLQRGFAIVRKAGKVVPAGELVHAGEHITIERARQTVEARVETTAASTPTTTETTTTL